MESTQDFVNWLDDHLHGGYEQVYALHQAITTESEFAEFSVERAKNGALIVTGDTSKLILATDKARDAFIRLLIAQNVEPGMDIGAWYGMNKGLEAD